MVYCPLNAVFFLIGEGYCSQLVPSFCPVCTPFYTYNSKTIIPIKLKFGGQIFHGVQMNFSKFGEI